MRGRILSWSVPRSPSWLSAAAPETAALRVPLLKFPDTLASLASQSSRDVVQRSDHGPERFDEKRQFAHPIRSSFCAAAFFLFLPQQPPPPFDMPARDVNCGFIVLSAILLTMLACFALIRRKP
jgi:hypothetical protein